MASNSGDTKLGKFLDETQAKISDFLGEQVWFQEIKTKWDELEPTMRRNIAYGGGAASVVGIFLFILVFVLGVYSKKSDYGKKLEILSMIQGATQEVRFLKQRLGADETGGTRPEKIDWRAALSVTAGESNIQEAALEVTPEQPGENNGVTSESLLEVTVKHINIRQAVRFAFAIENSPHPMKIRNMTVDTEGSEGYLNAKYFVSAFALTPKK